MLDEYLSKHDRAIIHALMQMDASLTPDESGRISGRTQTSILIGCHCASMIYLYVSFRAYSDLLAIPVVSTSTFESKFRFSFVPQSVKICIVKFGKDITMKVELSTLAYSRNFTCISFLIRYQMHRIYFELSEKNM